MLIAQHKNNLTLRGDLGNPQDFRAIKYASLFISGDVSVIWFKHMASASDGETLSLIEEKFGLEGYARFFKLLEVVASKSDKDSYFAEYSEKKWSAFLRAKPKKLRMFLECLEDLGVICTEQTGNVLRINMPNLAKFQQKDLGRSRPSRERAATNPPLEKEEETEKEIEKDKKKKEKALMEKDFEDIWPKLKVTPDGRNSKQDTKGSYILLKKEGIEDSVILKYWENKKTSWKPDNQGGFHFHSKLVNVKDFIDSGGEVVRPKTQIERGLEMVEEMYGKNSEKTIDAEVIL